jgi:hypothetical protein
MLSLGDRLEAWARYYRPPAEPSGAAGSPAGVPRTSRRFVRGARALGPMPGDPEDAATAPAADGAERRFTRGVLQKR